jgi:hypothetical protein
MSFMFEVYYPPPADDRKEAVLTERVATLGGCLTSREVPESGLRSVCLTYEFEGHDQAEAAAEVLRSEGEYVEGPMDYSD